MWWMHRRIVPERLPSVRVVVEFVHTAPARTRIWLVFDRGEVSVCMQHPGYDSDVVVTSPTTALSGVFNGVDSWEQLVADGTIVVEGPPRLARALPRWFQWSPFVPEMRAAERRAMRSWAVSPPGPIRRRYPGRPFCWYRRGNREAWAAAHASFRERRRAGPGPSRREPRACPRS